MPVMLNNILTVSIISPSLVHFFFFQKIFDEEILIKLLPTTPLQIFCEFMLYSKVIYKSIMGPDDNLSKSSPGMNGLTLTCAYLDRWRQAIVEPGNSSQLR